MVTVSSETCFPFMRAYPLHNKELHSLIAPFAAAHRSHFWPAARSHSPFRAISTLIVIQNLSVLRLWWVIPSLRTMKLGNRILSRNSKNVTKFCRNREEASGPKDLTYNIWRSKPHKISQSRWRSLSSFKVWAQLNPQQPHPPQLFLHTEPIHYQHIPYST
jgi:hypothetical protein